MMDYWKEYISWIVGINGLNPRLPLCVRESCGASMHLAAATDEIEPMVLSV